MSQQKSSATQEKAAFVVNLVLILPTITLADDAQARLRRLLFDLPTASFEKLRAAVASSSTMTEQARAYYLAAKQEDDDEWDRIVREAVIEIAGQTVTLKVPFPANDADYNEVSEDGRRLWLRQHIDDRLWYRMKALSDVRTELVFSLHSPGNCPYGTLAEITELEDAIRAALERASQLRTDSFWIEGE